MATVGVRLSTEVAATSNEDVLGPVFCDQIVQAPVAAYGETCEVVPPIQEEEAVLTNLLSTAPCMFFKRRAGNDVNATADRVRTQGKLVANGQEADFNGDRTRNLQVTMIHSHQCR